MSAHYMVMPLTMVCQRDIKEAYQVVKISDFPSILEAWSISMRLGIQWCFVKNWKKLHPFNFAILLNEHQQSLSLRMATSII